MDNPQENGTQPFDQTWFDVVDLCGKEFQLPNVSTPINLRWSDCNNLAFFEDQQPDIYENFYESEMTCSSCAGNGLDSFPLMEIVFSLTNSVTTVSPSEGCSLGNHKIHFPQANQYVFVPTPTINPLVSSTNSSRLRNNPIYASGFDYRSEFRSGGFPTINNQEIIFSFTG
ncbi:hypothetical protein C1H46_039748 [Malus baccata]|uniref:Uncharacterized protein n=1 Tax=Malus baccata TaxID=106549 RepID=A0A540KKF8_MALBA|nr:hypothetical protein C1H46_039748 [Malus baccata]